MGSQPRAKAVYRPARKLEVFYTGGAAKLSPDGNLLACACGDEVKVVDVASGTVTRTFAGDTEPITALCFATDSKTLFAASRSLVAKRWDLATGQCLRSWKPHTAPVADMAVDPTGTLLATSSADRTVRVFDIEGGFCTHVFRGHTGVVLRVGFHPDPARLQLVSAGDDSEARVWDLNERSCTFELKGHFSAVTCFGFSPDGWTLVTGGRDRVAHTWDLRTGRQLTTIPLMEAVEGLVVLPPGSALPGAPAQGSRRAAHFAVAGERGSFRVFRSDTASCVYDSDPRPSAGKGKAADAAAEAPRMASQAVYDLALVPGGDRLMALWEDCRLAFYGPAAGSSGTAALALERELVGNMDEVTDMRVLSMPARSDAAGASDGGSGQPSTSHPYAPGQPTHIAVASNGEDVRIFDTTTLSCVRALKGHSAAVLVLDAWRGEAGSGTGTLLASGSKDNTLRVWDPASGECLGRGEGHIASVTGVSLSKKTGAFAVTAGADKLIKVWDLSPALERLATSAQAGPSASPAAPLRLRVTGATAGHDKEINTVAVAPNDSICVTGSQDKTAKVWRLPDLVPVMTLRGHRRGVWGIDFSPIDKVVATSSGDKTIRLWSLKDGSCLKTLEGHTASVLRVSFISLGTQLISSGADGLVKLWNIRSAECAGTFEEHEGKVWSLAPSSSASAERLVVTGGADSTICVWEDATEAEEHERQHKRDEDVLAEQALSNAIAASDYLKAARIALSLKQPGRLLSVLQKCAAGQGAEARLGKLAAGLEGEDLRLTIEYIREWNAKAKTCHVAQSVLHAIVRSHTPSALSGVPGARDLLSGIEVYTKRHVSRMDRLMRSAYLLDYTLKSLKVLVGSGEEAEDEGEEARGEEDAGPAAPEANGKPALFKLPDGRMIDLATLGLPPGFDPSKVRFAEAVPGRRGGDDEDDFGSLDEEAGSGDDDGGSDEDGAEDLDGALGLEGSSGSEEEDEEAPAPSRHALEAANGYNGQGKAAVARKPVRAASQRAAAGKKDFAAAAATKLAGAPKRGAGRSAAGAAGPGKRAKK